MSIFSKKKNGDYFIQMIQTLTEIKSDNKHIKEGFDDHVNAGRTQREEDKKEKQENRDWQKDIDLKLAKAIECPKATQIDTNTDDIKEFKKDKQLRTGKILGMKFIYVVVIGILSFTALILGIMWRFGMV